MASVKRRTFKYPARAAAPAVLRDAATRQPPLLLTINVRAAKDQLSSLLEQAARGNEVVITSDGLPKAKLVPIRIARKPFRVNWALLRSRRGKAGGKSADELVREDRDARP